jgi:integrase
MKDIGTVIWHDESYEKDGKRVNPHPGVMYLVSRKNLPPGKTEEKVYYIVYRDRNGNQHREPVGRQYRDRMTPAKAAGIREARIKGDEKPNRERRKEKRAAKEAERTAVENRWEFGRLFTTYQESKGEYPRRVNDNLIYRTHLAPVIGAKTPSEVQAFDVDRIKRDMKKSRKVVVPSRIPGGKVRVVDKGNCAAGTIFAALEFLVRLSNFGKKRNLCEGIPFHVEKPKVNASKQPEAMTDEQLRAYLEAAAACENKVIGAALRFELLTGVRLGEARGLRWSDVGLDRGTILLREPKGGKDVVLPLDPAAVDLLKQLPRDDRNVYVFQGEQGGRFGISTVARYGREFATAAGLPKGFRPNHGLRHSYASALASSGEVDLYTIQRLLTHKSSAMTQRYAHLRDETLRRGAGVMARIVGTAATADQEKAETA